MTSCMKDDGAVAHSNFSVTLHSFHSQPFKGYSEYPAEIFTDN